MLKGVEFDNKQKAIIISYFDSQGRDNYIARKLEPNEMFNWKTTTDTTDFKSWDGKSLIQKPSGYLSRFRLEEIIMTKLSKMDRDNIYSESVPKVYFMDIETVSDEAGNFPKPEEANYPINIISVVSGENIFVLSTIEDFPAETLQKMEREVNEYYRDAGIQTNYKLRYVFYHDEKSLLQSFVKSALPKMGLISGWNVIDFDWLTIANRCDKLDIDITQFLKSKKIVGTRKLPVHQGILDYQTIVMKLNLLRDPENFTLDYVSKRVLGVSKLKNPYKSFFEFQKDGYLFTKYNIIDSCNVQLLDTRLNGLKLVYEILKITKIEINKVFSPVFRTEMLFCREYFKNGLHLPDISKDSHKKKSKYKGAYVMEPIPGHYRYASCLDFESQYPKTQMQWNISPEVYIGKYGEVDVSGIDPRRIIKTKCGTMFWGDRDSVARVIQRDLFNNRKEIKGKGGTLQNVKTKIKSLEDERKKLLEIIQST